MHTSRTRSTYLALGLTGLALLLVGLPPLRADTIYVDDDAPSCGDGLSWDTPFKYLQDALGAANPSDEIRVAEGRYEPDRDCADPNGTGDRTATFQLISGVALYGGYAGLSDPNNPDEQDIALYETILSGDLARDDGPDFANNGENAYHVVTANSTATLDGFTISGGNADADWPHDAGGGILCDTDCNPTISYCTVSGNSSGHGGGGISCLGGTISNCTVEANSTRIRGGGISCQGGTVVTNCTITRNEALYRGGGIACVGAFNGGGDPTVSNCAITWNTAGVSGGGLCLLGGSTSVANCTFSHNTALLLGGGLCCEVQVVPAPPPPPPCPARRARAGPRSDLGPCSFYGDGDAKCTLTNCILWEDHAPAGPEIGLLGGMGGYRAVAEMAYCDVQGGEEKVWLGPEDELIWLDGNIDEDPRFVDPNSDDYHLLPASPCIDAGNSKAMPRDTSDVDEDGCVTDRAPLDLDGNYRFHDDPNTADAGVATAWHPAVDMGACEFGSDPNVPAGPCFADLNCDGSVNSLDVDPFVLALTDPNGYGSAYPGCNVYNADCDEDGSVNSLDIDPFVEVLTGG